MSIPPAFCVDPFPGGQSSHHRGQGGGCHNRVGLLHGFPARLPSFSVGHVITKTSGSMRYRRSTKQAPKAIRLPRRTR